MDTDQLAGDPHDKTELMERIHRSWYALERAISDLTDQQLTQADRGGWSIKDNLAHLSTWEKILLERHIQRHPFAEVIDIPADQLRQLDEDGLNAIIFERSQGRSLEEVLAAFRHTHQELLAELELHSFEDLLKPRNAKDPQKRPLLGWVIGDTYEHYQEHFENIQKLIQSWK